MDQTEIQKVPGRFNLPKDWPRLVLPDLTSDLLADWRAEDLPVGAMPVTGWRSAAGPQADALKLVNDPGRALPVVAVDGNGNKYARFTNSLLQAATLWDGPVTIVATVRPDADATGVQRIITGPSGRFRSVARQGTGFAVGVTGLTAYFTTSAQPGELAIVAARFTETDLDAVQYGFPWSPVKPIEGGYPRQDIVAVGSNIAAPGTEGFFKGDIYRLQVWGRAMSNADVEAALQSNFNAYGL